jgi:hypothetical protein
MPQNKNRFKSESDSIVWRNDNEDRPQSFVAYCKSSQTQTTGRTEEMIRRKVLTMYFNRSNAGSDDFLDVDGNFDSPPAATVGVVTIAGTGGSIVIALTM